MLYRRLIEHAHTSNIHVHIGVPELTKEYPYWVHITGDIRTATFEVGDVVDPRPTDVLTVLDHPAVQGRRGRIPGKAWSLSSDADSIWERDRFTIESASSMSGTSPRLQ